MTVSIIIPAHNSAATICHTLDSLVQQTYQDFEVCVALDNCSDQTALLVAEHPLSNKIRTIECHKGSPAGARNEALTLAKGEYLAFLDADDHWLPEKLEHAVAELKTDADFVYHNLIIQNRKTGHKYSQSFPSYSNYSCMLLTRGNCIATSSVVFRPGRVKIRFDESMEFFGTEDFHLWVRLAHAGLKFKLIDKVLGYYVVDHGSVSDDKARSIRNAYHVVRHYHRNSNLPWTTKIGIYGYYLKLGQAYIKARFRLALSSFMKQENKR